MCDAAVYDKKDGGYRTCATRHFDTVAAEIPMRHYDVALCSQHAPDMANDRPLSVPQVVVKYHYFTEVRTIIGEKE